MEGLSGNWTRSIRWKVMVSSSRLMGYQRVCHSGGSVGWAGLHQLEADVGQVKRLAGVREVDGSIHVCECLCVRVCCLGNMHRQV